MQAGIPKAQKKRGTSFNIKREQYIERTNDDSDSQIKKEAMLSQGQAFLDLEHLFNALDAIDEWQMQASRIQGWVNRQSSVFHSPD